MLPLSFAARRKLVIYDPSTRGRRGRVRKTNRACAQMEDRMNFRPHGSGIILSTILGAAVWAVVIITLYLGGAVLWH
jgi:hypothetical protein